MRFRRHGPAILILAALATSVASASPPPDVAAVESAMHSYERLLAAKDSAGTAAMYASDGELLQPGMDPLTGPEAIRKFLDSFGDVRIESATMTADSTEVFGDRALQWGAYAQRVVPSGQQAADYKGRFVIEWTRQGKGAWLIRRLLVQPSPPPRHAD
jgi:uncharacterized protein (TIGR02246 family)